MLDSILFTSPQSEHIVAYYPLDGDAKNTAHNFMHGTKVGDVKLSEDRFGNPGKALRFNGKDSFFKLDSVKLQSGNAELKDFTVSVWVRLLSFNPKGREGRSYILDLRGDGIDNNNSLAITLDVEPSYAVFKDQLSQSPAILTGYSSELAYWANTHFVLCYSLVPFRYTESASPIIHKNIQNPVGRWTHFVYVRETSEYLSEVRVYVDGIRMQTYFILDTGGSLPISEPMSLENGGRIANTAENGKYRRPELYFLHGDMDDILIYACALTEEEILELYTWNGWRKNEF
ncbi:MAG: LamG domain-containing protein [Ignavibacteriae bacterium]|nr:LamG domain-containing protein [Ignavibacteriota bacterium]